MKRRFSYHYLLPGFSLVFTLFVFAPVDLYLSVRDELWFPLAYLVRWLAVAGFAALIMISLLSAFLPGRISIAFRSVVYACSFLAYLQGNLLLLDYGKLDGRNIDWSSYTMPYILDALLWIVVTALFVFLMFRFRKKFRRFVEIAACVLLVTQAMSVLVFLIGAQGQQVGEENSYLSREGEFSVSSESNVIVFVLDTFDSHLFERLRRDDPDLISESFEDFTFYYDTVGGATRTKYAIPFILTGTANRWEQSYTRYLSESFGESPLIRELASGNYETGLYTVSHYIDMSREDAIGNIAHGIPVPSSRIRLTTQFMRLVAFRYAPSVLSRYFWMYTGDFERWKGDAGTGVSHKLNNLDFYQQFVSEGLKASAGKPCFRFYHLSGVHQPYTMDENIQAVTDGTATEAKQAVGSLKIVSEYLSQLRSLGVYDRTTVIIMADHGFSKYSKVEQSPLFMVKLSGDSHPFETSDLPLSYSDLPDIMVSALRGSLTSLEPWKASSPRYFYFNKEENAVTDLIEYKISGPVWDTPAKKTGVIFHENTLSLSRQYTLGTTLYFDERATARGYCVSGFSGNEGTRTWTEAYDAEMLFMLPEVPGTLQLVLDYDTYRGSQTVEVWVNDQLIETRTASGKTHQTVMIPSGTVTGTELRLRLHLPDAVSPASFGHSTDQRLLALSMNSLAIRVVDP